MITLTQLLLLVTISVFFLLAFYLEFFIPKQKGKSLLMVKLKQRHRIDGAIFIALVLLLFYHYGLEGGAYLTGYLMAFLFILSVYFYFVRTPKLILKSTGFFYGAFFIHYDRITAMQLNEKGILFFQLGQKTLDIHVSTLEDLECIYHVLANLNYSHPTRV